MLGHSIVFQHFMEHRPHVREGSSLAGQCTRHTTGIQNGINTSVLTLKEEHQGQKTRGH
jgi:hypothetical protein